MSDFLSKAPPPAPLLEPGLVEQQVRLDFKYLICGGHGIQVSVEGPPLLPPYWSLGFMNSKYAPALESGLSACMARVSVWRRSLSCWLC